MFDTFPDVLTVEQVCKALALGKNSVYRLLMLKQLNAIKIGRKYIIPKQYLIDYINANKV